MIREKSTKTQVVGFNFYYCIQQVVGTHHLLPAVPHDHVEAVGAALGQLHPVPVLHTTQSDCYAIRNIVISNGKQGPHQTKQKAVTTDNISHHRQQRRYQTQQIYMISHFASIYLNNCPQQYFTKTKHLKSKTLRNQDGFYLNYITRIKSIKIKMLSSLSCPEKWRENKHKFPEHVLQSSNRT